MPKKNWKKKTIVRFKKESNEWNRICIYSCRRGNFITRRDYGWLEQKKQKK